MQTELVVFDMDGTLANTAPGIIASFLEVAHVLDIQEPPLESVYQSTSGSLMENLMRIYGLDNDQAVEALGIFKDYYNSTGYLQSELFPGMRETLEAIHGKGIKLGVATMKLDEYAKQLVDHWGLGDLFVDVCGADVFGTLTKSDLIDKCIYAAGVDSSETLMVGDTVHDMKGARDSGTRFVAVTFGYGFTPDLCRENGIPFTETAGGVLDFL